MKTLQQDYEFKSFTLDVDSNHKSERPEWGEGKYQGDTVHRITATVLTIIPIFREISAGQSI